MEVWIDYIGVWVGGLIFDQDGKILLLKRGLKSKNRIWYWSMPWWKLEFGETLENALKREIKEELDIDVELEDLLWIKQTIFDQHWINVLYVVKVIGGVIKNVEKNYGKCDEISRFDLDNLPDFITSNALFAIDTYKIFKNIE